MSRSLPPLFRVDVHGSRSRESAILRRRVLSGELHRIVPGRFVDTHDWRSLTVREQHLLTVRAVASTLPASGVVSHISAAAVFEWADLDVYPSRVHLTDPGLLATVTRRHIVRHASLLAPDDVWRTAPAARSIAVTSPLRTAVDVALSLPFASAVVTLDSALGRADVGRDALLIAIDAAASEGRRGAVAARRAVEFADSRAGSAAESFARVRLLELGAPVPQLQRRLVTPGGQLAGIVDFFFAEQGVVLEIDGVGKYTDPEYLRGGTSAAAFIDEKAREHRLFECPEVTRVVRAGWRELRARGSLAAMLLASGVPVSRL